MENINFKDFFVDDSFYTKKGQAEILKNNLDLEVQKKILSSNNDLYRCNCGVLLTREQEFSLFRRFNYFKYRISEIEKWKTSNSNKERERKKKIKSIFDIREIIIKCNTRLMINPAKKFSNSQDLDSVECSEYISNGYVHLFKAIDKFDYNRGFKFSTYFCNVLFRNLSRDKQVQINKTMNHYELDEKTISVAAEDETHQERIASYNEVFLKNLIAKLEIEDNANRLKKRFRRCDSRHISRSVVLKRTYGICGERKHTLREVSKDLGVSHERIRQIRIQAEEFIKSNFNTFELYDPMF